MGGVWDPELPFAPVLNYFVNDEVLSVTTAHPNFLVVYLKDWVNRIFILKVSFFLKKYQIICITGKTGLGAEFS